MSELSKMIRLMVQGDKEARVTRVTPGHIPQLFTSQLTEGHGRRRLFAISNSATGSGEVGYSYTGEADFDHCFIVPIGEKVWVPVHEALSVYYMAELSGEANLDIRFEEIA